MHAPRGGFGRTKLCKLLTSLYGLKQAPRAWYDKLCESLITDYGFERSAIDPCLFRKQHCTGKNGTCNGCWVYMLVYVDDFLIGSQCSKPVEWVKQMLEGDYKMTDLGVPADFLGIELIYVRAAESSTGRAYCL